MLVTTNNVLHVEKLRIFQKSELQNTKVLDTAYCLGFCLSTLQVTTRGDTDADCSMLLLVGILDVLLSILSLLEIVDATFVLSNVQLVLCKLYSSRVSFHKEGDK